LKIVVGDVEAMEAAYAEDFEAFGRILLWSGEPGSGVA